MVEVTLEPSWKAVLQQEFNQPYFERLVSFVTKEYKHHTVYPKGSQIFAAFDATPWDKVRVVILGQDPYHGPGQAHGLSFSVPEGIAHPKSLQNIFKELQTDMGIDIPVSGNLERWSKQGVLLLNATLTVRSGQAGSHQKQGWERFTDAVIHHLAMQKEHLVFVLWGRYAQEKGKAIDPQKHLVLTSPHPSPLSAYRGFFGSAPFSAINAYLQHKGQQPIQW